MKKYKSKQGKDTCTFLIWKSKGNIDPSRYTDRKSHQDLSSQSTRRIVGLILDWILGGRTRRRRSRSHFHRNIILLSSFLVSWDPSTSYLLTLTSQRNLCHILSTRLLFEDQFGDFTCEKNSDVRLNRIEAIMSWVRSFVKWTIDDFLTVISGMFSCYWYFISHRGPQLFMCHRLVFVVGIVVKMIHCRSLL